MFKYVAKRILLMIPILFMVIFIVYFLLDLAPGNPGQIILGETASIEDIEALNEQLGYNNPFFVRFFNYIKNLIINRNFGTSWRTNRDVMTEVLARFPVTFRLAAFGVLLATLIGVPIGIVSAVKQYSTVDNISRVLAMLLAAFPPFWLGMLMILLFSVKLGWLPPSSITTPLHYVLPVITIAIPQAASLLRFSRSTMLETIRQDYIRTARAKGVPERKVILRHGLRNALLPIVTVLGDTFGRLLGGVVIIEAVFAIPGMGQFALNAILMKDVPQVMASVIFLSAVFCLIMLVVDVLYIFIDPRIKSAYSAKKK